MTDTRTPCTIVVQPWFKDHAVAGKIVLPAVESMLLLASQGRSLHPEIDVRVMEDVGFGKLFEIPANVAAVSAQVACAPSAGDRIRIKLVSHMQLGSMARIKEHAEIFFPRTRMDKQLPIGSTVPPLTGKITEITAQHLYQELVPFGRCYQTLQDTLYLSENQAWGHLQAALLPFTYPLQDVLGSPFPLDGAMHAACVLGQQFVDFAPFPVGFARRVIFRPTQPGKPYLTGVTMTSQNQEQLTFDLTIFDKDGLLYEAVTGLRMRDVGKAIKNRPRN